MLLALKQNSTAQNIVNYREENGAFTLRPQIENSSSSLDQKAYMNKLSVFLCEFLEQAKEC